MAPPPPSDLIDKIYQGNTVLFVGAGLSVGIGLPTWPELMDRIIKWSVERNIIDNVAKEEFEQWIEQKKFLLLIQELRERMGNRHFMEFMSEVFRDDTKEPTPTHKILPEIPFAAVLTTNFDVLIESAYTSSLGVKARTYTQADIPELAHLHSSGQFYILKLHGDIDRIETVVLGRNDYRQVMFANNAYRDFLTALLLIRTVLFVGFSLADPDLLLLLDKLETAFKGYGGLHYALINEQEVGKIERERWRKDYGIDIIPYRATEGHPEVHTFLDQIAEAIVERYISGPLDKVKKIQEDHFGANVLVIGSNPRVRTRFFERLIEIIPKADDHYTYYVIHLDMSDIESATFFSALETALLQVAETDYPTLHTLLSESGAPNEPFDFQDMVSEMTEVAKQQKKNPIKIILLFYHAEIWNYFPNNVKEQFRAILNEQEELKAVLIARKFDFGEPSTVSQWYSVFKDPIELDQT